MECDIYLMHALCYIITELDQNILFLCQSFPEESGKAKKGRGRVLREYFGKRNENILGMLNENIREKGRRIFRKENISFVNLKRKIYYKISCLSITDLNPRYLSHQRSIQTRFSS